jgi:hypothetical protein
VRWLTPVIPAYGKQKQEGGEFLIILSYIARPYLKTKKEYENK